MARALGVEEGVFDPPQFISGAPSRRFSDFVMGNLDLLAAVRVVAGGALGPELRPGNGPIPGWRVLAGLGERRVEGTVGGVEEEGRTEPMIVFVGHHAVHGGSVAIIGPDLSNVSEIDDQISSPAFEVVPDPSLFNLETRFSVV